MKQKLDYFDVNNRIIQIMREKGYNKNSLAKVMGMAQPTIKQIENKEAFPDINFNWLLTGRGNKVDLIGEYDIKHEGVVEYDLDADGYSMRYHDGVDPRGPSAKNEKDDKNEARIDKMLGIIESQQRQLETQARTIELLAQKGAAGDVLGVAGKAVRG